MARDVPCSGRWQSASTIDPSIVVGPGTFAGTSKTAWRLSRAPSAHCGRSRNWREMRVPMSNGTGLCAERDMRSPMLAIVICAAAVAASPQAKSQQATLDGTWNGGGTVILPSGDRERARCRATFRTRSANRVDMSAQYARRHQRASRNVANSRARRPISFPGSFTIRSTGCRARSSLPCVVAG